MFKYHSCSNALLARELHFNQNSLLIKSDLGVIPYCYFYSTVGVAETIYRRALIQHTWIINYTSLLVSYRSTRQIQPFESSLHISERK